MDIKDKHLSARASAIPARLRRQLQEAQSLGALGLAGALLQAVSIGLISGLVIGIFRIAYQALEALSVEQTAGWLTSGPGGLALVAAGLAFLWLVSCVLLRIEPMISGSGIPQVELAQSGLYPPMVWHRLLAAKFLATLASLTAGLSVGRQGPSIQMGAAVGVGVGTLLHGKHAQEMHRYLSAGAVAGMSAAFSSPLAGLLFAIEDMRVVVGPLMLVFLGVASLTAWACVTFLLGLPEVMPFDMLAPLTPFQHAAVVPLALLMGLLGAFYCQAFVRTTLWEDRCQWLKGGRRVAVPFIAAGILLVIYPDVIVGFAPDPLDLELTKIAAPALLLLLAVKIAFSTVCFASGVAGGILIPILMVGATAGTLCAGAMLSPGLASASQYGTLMSVCMAGFFAAVVRTPLTAAALLLEITGAWTSAPAIIASALIASWTASRTGTRPIYESMRARILAGSAPKHPHEQGASHG